MLTESYHYTPLYFTLIKDGKLQALLPLMEVKSILTGKRGVSLPFSDYCEPIIDGDLSFQDVFNHLIKLGRERNWKSIDIKGGKDLFGDTLASSNLYIHNLDLTQDEDQLFSQLRDSTRRNIQKADRENVEVEICTSDDAMKEFYRLNCITRKKHGIPPQPRFFFRKLQESIISKGFGFTALASYNKKVIAGAVFFHLGNKALFKYGASDNAFHHLRPNNLTLWEAIKWYSRNGYKTLSFGRTEEGFEGLRQFKTGWSVREETIKYYTYDLKKDTFVSGGPELSDRLHKIFQSMPLPLSRIIGTIFYKHAG
ncbi:MAG: GNAT family N-acetyltransferase [Proteobacteria bacterium]|nr:GNAT family N-acetyltransferase [Pseudomonadota bacterium]